MKLLDRTLLFLASFCIIAIIFIVFSSGELNSRHIQKKIIKKKSINEISNNIVIFNEEIDKIIEKYFQTIKEHPEQEEEEARLVEDNFEEKILEENKEIKIAKKIKKEPYFYEIKHLVKQGESLWRIASQYGIPIYSIVSANPSKSNTIIQPGEELKIPNRKGIYHKVKRRESLGKISKKYKTKIKEIILANKIQKSRIIIGQNLFIPNATPLPKVRYREKRMFIWPLSRVRVSSSYGWRSHPIQKRRKFHRGLDLLARYGAPIRAAKKGVVIFAGWGNDYGRMVILRHKKGYFTVYAHCSKILVKKGQLVRKRSRIAKVGSSGLSTRAHLHFEVKRFKRHLNPWNAMKIKERVPIL